MPKTYSDQLTDVQQAIADIELRGQSVDLNGKRLTRADLATLHTGERYLRRAVDRETRGGMRIRQVVPLDD